MSEELVTRQQLQDAVEDLQSAMSDESALQGAINRDLNKAVNDLKGLPENVQKEILEIWQALNRITDTVRQQAELQAKAHAGTLKLLQLVIKFSQLKRNDP